LLEEYMDVAQKYYPDFFRDKGVISYLSYEETFLEDIFISIQREEPVMLLSMTSTPSHNKVAKYYKEKIGKLAIERYSNASFYSIHPAQKKDISEEKYFSTLAKQCKFKENISDSLDFIEQLQQQLELQNVFLLISDFENGSDRYREELASEIRALIDNSYAYEHSFYIVIFGRKKMARLKYEENQQGISPLNIFEDFLVPIPTVKDYQYIENTKSDISDIYTLTGGHPELIKLCLRAKTDNYEELLISNSERFFKNYRYKKERILKLFNQENFGNYSIWSIDELLCDLFWDNLIVQDGSRFRWIAPIVIEMGKRYFR